MSIYTDAKKAGILMDNYYSDLYLADTSAAREIVSRNNVAIDGHNVMSFNDPQGAPWLDIAFGFDPYWDDRGLPIFTREQRTEK